MPLSPAESSAWARIDSLARQQASFGDRVRDGLGLAVFATGDPDFFHFNRVDGTYLGAGQTWREVPGLTLHTKLGYATGSERWQYRAGGRLHLSEPQRRWIGAWYHDETVTRPTFVSRAYNPTYRALLFRLDPRDYHHERGFTVAAAPSSSTSPGSSCGTTTSARPTCRWSPTTRSSRPRDRNVPT